MSSDTKFTASNYGIETTARQEWEIVTTGAYPTSCSADYLSKSKLHRRKLHTLRYAMIVGLFCQVSFETY